MKLICVIQLVPNVDHLAYDTQGQIVNEAESSTQINQDDACALGFALKMKKADPGLIIEVLTLARTPDIPLIEDLLRVGFDRATIIADEVYGGSDALIGARILSRYLRSVDFDWILTGSDANGAGCPELPHLIAELLDLDSLSDISAIEERCFDQKLARVERNEGFVVSTYELDGPAVFGISNRSGYRLPYVRLRDRGLDVSTRLTRLNNEDLKFNPLDVGDAGSKTRISEVRVNQQLSGVPLMVSADEAGIQMVYNFLKDKRFL